MMENLAKLKLLLGIETDDYDVKLQLVWETLERQTMIVIGRAKDKTIPEGLDAVILQMAVDYFSRNTMGIDVIKANNVKSISRGDTEITYNIADMASIGAFVSLYSDLLWAFRKVVIR